MPFALWRKAFRLFRGKIFDIYLLYLRRISYLWNQKELKVS